MRFGIQLNPVASGLDDIRALARQADAAGLELLGVQDHPYAADLADTFALIATVLADTERLRVFPDVASLPMRGPAMVGKQAATLDLLSGGRFELALGAGAFWPAIQAMGGPARTTREALAALTEAIEIIRAMWRPGETVRVKGEHYTVDGVHAGPAPAHPVGIWLGSVGPRALALTGRVADGWAAPIPHYLNYEKWPEAQRIITGAAVEAGRDPASITRISQLVGHITAEPTGPPALTGETPVHADAATWARVIADLATGGGFDSFVYWPEQADADQLRRWTDDVIPAVRELLA